MNVQLHEKVHVPVTVTAENKLQKLIVNRPADIVDGVTEEPELEKPERIIPKPPVDVATKRVIPNAAISPSHCSMLTDDEAFAVVKLMPVLFVQFK